MLKAGYVCKKIEIGIEDTFLRKQHKKKG